MNGIHVPRLTNSEMVYAAKSDFRGGYLPSLTKTELKSIATENYLRRSGNKDQLVERIQEWLRNGSLEEMAKYAQKYRDWTCRQNEIRKQKLWYAVRSGGYSWNDYMRLRTESWLRCKYAEEWVKESRNNIWRFSQREAAAMGGLQRLGAQSWLRHLDHGVMDMVLRQV